MGRRFLLLGSLLAVAVVAAPAGASAASSKTRYYLALGDSLSVGFQPNATGAGVETSEGYTNDLSAFEHARIASLKLVELGCPGETTGSMISGNGDIAGAKLYRCDRAGGSQLKAAERFLKAHHSRGEVPLVTIDIGANNIDGCAHVPISQLGACVSNGESSIKHDLPIILRAIRKAAPGGAKFAGMTLYDPVLSEYFSASSSARAIAAASVSLAQQVNGYLTGADQSFGFKTADVAGAFDTYDTSQMVAFDAQMIPIDVARVCSWTWACTTPPSGPDIHGNRNGYAVMAGAFEKVVGRLH